MSFDVSLQRRLAAQQTYQQQTPPQSNPFAGQNPQVGGVQAPQFGGPTQPQGNSNNLLGGVSSAFSADGSAGRVVPGGFNGGQQGANLQIFA